MAESDKTSNGTSPKAKKRRKAPRPAEASQAAQPKRAAQKPSDAASTHSAAEAPKEAPQAGAAPKAKKRRPAHAASGAKAKAGAGAAANATKKPARHARPAQNQPSTRDAASKPAKKGVSLPNIGALNMALPVLSIALALVGATLLYRYVFPPVATPEDTEAQNLEAAAGSEDANAASNVYNGVESPYTYSGYFSTGNDELDLQVKTFCDAIADPTLEARDNAQRVFEKIVQSQNYTMRSASDKPGGPEWYLVCAEQYFASATPDQGLPGSGDYYDYAAAISYCLRYFGFSDALAVPLTDATGTSFGQAVVVVTDVSGTSCVCDPSKPYAGWMLDSYSQNLIVENIGQDIAQEEAMGLTVSDVETDVTGQNQPQG